MDIGVPREIKDREQRVGLTPSSAREIVSHGHRVIVEQSAGAGIGASDADYIAAGASIAAGPQEIFDAATMIVKVKEPQPAERKMLRPDHLLFTYLHLAPDPDQTRDLVDSGAVCIAYETVTDRFGGLPLLAPMSKVAGRMAVQAGATSLEAPNGGAGLLIGGVPGVAPAKVTIIGGGVVGENATTIAVGMGAEVVVLDRDMGVLDRLSRRFGTTIQALYSTQASLEENVLSSDVVIGAVLVKGAKAPKLVTEQMVTDMRTGSVLVDVAIDQGGVFATSRPTTHSEPTYIVDDVVHYCVANMPGAVPKTSTYALNNSTLPFVVSLADKGARQALAEDPHLLNGLNVVHGKITEQAVAEALDYDYLPEAEALNLIT